MIMELTVYCQQVTSLTQIITINNETYTAWSLDRRFLAKV